MRKITLIEFLDKFGERVEQIWNELDQPEEWKPLLNQFQRDMWADYKTGDLDENLNDTTF
jgi:hypothetical protein